MGLSYLQKFSHTNGSVYGNRGVVSTSPLIFKIRKMKLFLDDVRNPTDCFGYVKAYGIRPDTYLGFWHVVKTYDEFVRFIQERGLPEIVSFDHDLADEHYNEAMYEGDDSYGKLYETFKEKTGYDAAKWLVNYCEEKGLPLPICFCHSMNPAGRQNINNLF
jgi:hypothetical protein